MPEEGIRDDLFFTLLVNQVDGRHVAVAGDLICHVFLEGLGVLGLPWN